MLTKILDNSEPLISGYLVRSDKPRDEALEIGDVVSVGREGANAIAIDDPFVSLRHARIERHERGFIIRDLRSRNGTLVNGVRVSEAVLRHQDRIRIGRTDLIFSSVRDVRPELQVNSSQNPYWNEQLQQLPDIAQSGLPVLINGPSGSGKEILAELLHRHSRRRDGPLICVNCSALGESLIESELFGHVRGSFTGATHDRPGAFISARGGTLFLDEIGDLPLSLQPKLLRALENREVRPVGSDKNIRTDVRIVAATHQDLKQHVALGKFRSDLFYRLHVVRLHAPALRDRIEDFETLLYQFAREFRVSFSVEAIEFLKSHSWPGNIRELKNTIARASAHFPRQQLSREQAMSLIDVIHSHPIDIFERSEPPRSIVRTFEYEMIQDRLIANRGNQRKTAADLGIPKSTLHDRIRSYRININHLLDGGGPQKPKV